MLQFGLGIQQKTILFKLCLWKHEIICCCWLFLLNNMKRTTTSTKLKSSPKKNLHIFGWLSRHQCPPPSPPQNISCIHKLLHSSNWSMNCLLLFRMRFLSPHINAWTSSQVLLLEGSLYVCMPTFSAQQWWDCTLLVSANGHFLNIISAADLW